jgi:hypothetical protein
MGVTLSEFLSGRRESCRLRVIDNSKVSFAFQRGNNLIVSAVRQPVERSAAVSAKRTFFKMRTFRFLSFGLGTFADWRRSIYLRNALLGKKALMSKYTRTFDLDLGSSTSIMSRGFLPFVNSD